MAPPSSPWSPPSTRHTGALGSPTSIPQTGRPVADTPTWTTPPSARSRSSTSSGSKVGGGSGCAGRSERPASASASRVSGSACTRTQSPSTCSWKPTWAACSLARSAGSRTSTHTSWGLASTVATSSVTPTGYSASATATAPVSCTSPGRGTPSSSGTIRWATTWKAPFSARGSSMACGSFTFMASTGWPSTRNS